MPKKLLLSILVVVVIGLGSFVTWKQFYSQNNSLPAVVSQNLPFPSPPVSLKQPPSQKILPTDYHIFQSFNNCGPAALSMTFRFYGINESQEKLGKDLRPYQNPQGDNDDKSVTLEELAEKSEEYGLTPFHRPNGNVEMIKYFITYDIPVIARTWTKPNEDIGHYRVVKGYDEATGEIIQDDSLQNKNLQFSYQDFNILWEKFNYEYLVLVPEDKVKIAEAILGEDVDEKIAWKNAADNARKRLAENPNNVNIRFNLSVALYNSGDPQEAIAEYEKVQSQLPFRTLWYEIEPVLAYKDVGNYNRVFAITDRILNNANRAFSELYKIRGDIYLKQGNIEEAKQQYELAIFYNQNYTPAREALNAL